MKEQGIYQRAVKRLLGVFLLLSLLGAMGCEELNFPNPNGPDLDNVSNQSLVTGIVAQMRDGHSLYLRVTGIIGREAYYFEPADPRFTGELLRGPIDAGGFLLNTPWQERYKTISLCNDLIARADGDNGINGFANTIIAHELLMNLNYLDNEGIKLDLSGDLNAPFATRAAAFAQINSLLDQGLTQLQGAGGSFSFSLPGGFDGFNTPAGFAQFNRAIKARVAVYSGDFNGALTALQASFLSLAAADFDAGVYHEFSSASGDQNNGIFEQPDAPTIKLYAHLSNGANAEAGDTRFSSKFLVRPGTTTFDGLSSNLAVTTTSGAFEHLPIIRNEELVLLRAEAYIGLTNYADAQADLNLVRAAYGLGDVTLDAGNALDRLLYEKRYSLFMEGHRWIDMRRYGRLGELPLDRSGDVIVTMPKPETEVGG